MEEILFENGILTYRGYTYSVGYLDKNEDEIAYVNLINDPYTFTIALVANETMINGVLQTSADMIIQTLSNE